MPQLFKALFLTHAEAVFLVDDDQAEVLESYVALQQSVGANHEIDVAIGELGQDLRLVRFAAESGKQFNSDRQLGKAIAEILIVLLCQ